MKKIDLILLEVSLQDFIDGYKYGCTKQNVINAMHKFSFEFEVAEYSDCYEITFYDGDIDDDIVIAENKVKK